jgi:branched-chain amino acid transport system permease protein
MEIATYVILMLDGISRGLLYFLIASGLTLTFGVMGIINFAHGAFFMIGAYLTSTLMSVLAGVMGSFWIAVIGSALIAGIIGAFLERFLIRRIYDSEHVYQLLLLFGLVLILDGLVIEVWGGQPRSIIQPSYLMGAISISGKSFPIYSLFILFLSLAIALFLYLVLDHTSLGKACRATSMDREMTSVLGINVRNVYMLFFGGGIGLAALTGGIGTCFRAVTPAMGTEILVILFVIIVIGGLGSLKGALVGAVLLGIVESFFWRYLPEIAMMIPYALMAVVLMARPQGLYGQG